MAESSLAFPVGPPAPCHEKTGAYPDSAHKSPPGCDLAGLLVIYAEEAARCCCWLDYFPRDFALILAVKIPGGRRYILVSLVDVPCYNCYVMLGFPNNIRPLCGLCMLELTSNPAPSIDQGNIYINVCTQL